MEIAQMMQHCSIQMKKALDIAPFSEFTVPVIYRTSIGKWLAIYVIPWQKD
jgi:hypothetical protein